MSSPGASRGAIALSYHCCTKRLLAFSCLGLGPPERLAYSQGRAEKDLVGFEVGKREGKGHGWKTLGARKGRMGSSASATSLTCRAAHRGIGGHRHGEGVVQSDLSNPAIRLPRQLFPDRRTPPSWHFWRVCTSALSLRPSTP